MLFAQANALQAVFYELLRRSGANMGVNLQATDTYMRLALKAQSQCRATLETLAAIKNPPVVYARQANIAHGHQQVNNGDARARENPNQSNEVLEVHERLEHRTPQTAGFGDPAMATVGPINGSEDAGGQGPLKPQ